jgi:hypothetical protein
MSLAPNEVSYVICEKSPDLACIMETWLYGSIIVTLAFILLIIILFIKTDLWVLMEGTVYM